MKPNRPKPKKGAVEGDHTKRVLVGVIVATVVVIAGIVALIVDSSNMLQEGKKTSALSSIVAFVKKPFIGTPHRTQFEASLPQDEMQYRINEALKKYEIQSDPKNPLGLKDEKIVTDILDKGMPSVSGWDGYMAAVDRAALLVINNGHLQRVQQYIRDVSSTSPEAMLAGLDVQYKALDTRYEGIKDSYLKGQQSIAQLSQILASSLDKEVDTAKDYVNTTLSANSNKITPSQMDHIKQKMAPAYNEMENSIAANRMTPESIYKKITSDSEIATRFRAFTYGMIDLRAQMLFNRAKADAVSSIAVH